MWYNWMYSTKITIRGPPTDPSESKMMDEISLTLSGSEFRIHWEPSLLQHIEESMELGLTINPESMKLGLTINPESMKLGITINPESMKLGITINPERRV